MFIEIGNHIVNLNNVTHISEAEWGEDVLNGDHYERIRKTGIVVKFVGSRKLYLTGDEAEAFKDYVSEMAANITPLVLGLPEWAEEVAA